VSVRTVEASLVSDLEAVLGPERVLTSPSQRAARSRVPAPFAVHRWHEFVPDAVLLPETTEEVQQIVQIARRRRVPLVPRAGGTGLADGAVPMRHGIVVDVKRMNRIVDLDLENRTVTVQPGINMLKLNEELLHRHGVFYPDDPASYPVSMVGGRIGTSGWSLLGARYGHTRDLVLSIEVVLPTGEVVNLGEGGGRQLRKSSIGLNLKQLFIGHQGTLGVVTQATLDLAPRPEVEASLFFTYESFAEAHRAIGEITRQGVASLGGCTILDERKIDFLRRDDEAYIPQGPDVRNVIALALYGTREEVPPAVGRLRRVAEEAGGRYLGDEVSHGDWSSRHERYATPLHGRRPDGQVVPMCWHVEDASIVHSEIPRVLDRWNEIVDRYVAENEIFDHWGAFVYVNNAFRGWGDYLLEIDVGIYEPGLNDHSWSAWLGLKRELALVTIEAGGSISTCHGGTRAGDLELVPVELGETEFDLIRRIKRAIDPDGIMNPGKWLFDGEE
jgi:glycolate oxidase